MVVPVSSDVNLFGLIFIFLHIIQNVELLVASPVLHSHFQRRLVDDHSGFISIDCGSTTDSYFDNITGLYYTSDKKYINSGINVMQPHPNAYTFGTLPGFTNLGKTIRQFPEGRKNCYTLSPVKPYNKYFIRAQFFYSGYPLPIFDVYIGVNLWFTLKTSKIISEIIHVATTTSIDVCLVNTNQGIPFISALELRPLDNSSYLVASPQLSLAIRHREDSGGGSVASPTGPYMVKDDTYNRQWYMYYDRDSNIIKTTESFDGSQADPYKVPTSVLSTALEKTNTSPELTISHKLMDPSPQVYYYWHFAELELLGSNDTREFNILVPQDPSYTSGPIRPKYLQVTTVSSPRISYVNTGQAKFSFTLRKTSNSTLYPILNACEVYFAVDLPVSPTIQEDVDAVTEIKDKYAVTRIWQGDPCLPANYQWDGLNCTFDGNTNSTRITSLNLSSSNLNGELPPSLSNLTSLTYLNLSHNALTGNIPKFLAFLPLLTVIDLSGNNLAGPVPQELAQKASNKSIDLRLAGNPDVCKSFQCEEKKRHPFIVQIVVSVVSVSFLVIIGITFLKFRRRTKKAWLVDGAIKQKSKQFNSSDLVRITDSFKKVLGKGGFGTVYHGVLEDGFEVAVKVLNHTPSAITVKQFCVEVDLLTRTHHANLVSLVGYCNEQASMTLVFEYMSCGDLHSQLSEKNENPLSWKRRLQISVDVAQGLEYLHSGCKPPIIHRDIKPANILLDNMGNAKIADFGLSRFTTTDSQGDVRTNLAGTRGYLDPECCKHQLINTLSEKSDVYAFGVVMLQLLTGQPTVLVKNTDYQDEYDIGHIVAWVSPKVESGDILAIIDKRLQGDLIVNSAWMFLEIVMGCVKPKGSERPRMSEVVSQLKACYASEGCRDLEHNVVDGVDNGNQALEITSFVSLPIAR